jgi:antibiotic biosynthesis monooxygenase (ABM) superfamily enzyme
MVVTHVAVFRWREGVDVHEQAARLGAALDELGRRVPGLLSLEHGADLDIWPRTFDFALIARFTDLESLRAYGANPEHQKVFEEHVRPVVESMGSVQLNGGER